MKTFSSSQKILVGLSLVFLTSACLTPEEPQADLSNSELASLTETALPGEENLRKGKAAERAYFERFKNQIIPTSTEAGLFFPGSGIGNATHMGKAATYLNQQFITVNGLPATIGAPVTDIYSNELAALGLNVADIPAEVSSITIDGKGNSVWFKNIQNIVKAPDANGIQTFQAVVEIVGGSGKFEGATGSGDVEGFFNSVTGKGESTIKGRITF
ncbi:hypothetical protein [Algoriphagus namhaensis]